MASSENLQVTGNEIPLTGVGEWEMPDHTVHAYDDELTELARKIAEMGGLAEQQVAASVTALTTRDASLAQDVIATDPRIDRLQRDVEDSAVLMLARRQPMALDLRDIVGAMHIANDLERVGDLAKNTAKRVFAVEGNLAVPRLMSGLEHIAELSLGQLKDVLDAYAARDAPAARSVWERDDEIDAVHTSLFRELLTYMMEDPRNITLCTHLLFCAKNLERIGDHATNIAETVLYLINGARVTEERPKNDASPMTSVVYKAAGQR
jgi:phosphate transport system protein